MNVDNKVPEIRFKGFTTNWLNFNLSQITDVYDGTHQTPAYTKSGVMFLSAENIMSLTSTKFISEAAFKKEFKVYPKKNDVLMTRIGDVGTANVVETDDDKAYYVTLALLKYKKLSPYFLKNSITSPFVQKDIWLRTLHIAFPKKINMNEIKQVAVNCPPDAVESDKIGLYFKNLDALITHHQQKHDKLTNIKKAMLEKMFPKQGKTIPDIRFDGFSREWKEVKLSKVSEKITEKNTSVIYSETFTNSAEFGIISQRDYFDKDISNSNNIGGYYVVQPEDFVYNPRISTLAPCGPINRNTLGRAGIMSPLYTVFRTKDVNTIFIEYFFQTKLWHTFMFLNGDTGARADRFSIKDSVFFELPLLLPTLNEQVVIGNYFQKLDALINQHQQQITKLNNIKQACLSKMFV